MEQYIKKSALLAEIEKIYNEGYKFLPSDIAENIQNFKDDVLINIDTLEVKDVDLEKEYDNEFFKDPVFCKLVNRNAGISIAKHFFELGMQVSNKSQKGENV